MNTIVDFLCSLRITPYIKIKEHSLPKPIWQIYEQANILHFYTRGKSELPMWQLKVQTNMRHLYVRVVIVQSLNISIWCILKMSTNLKDVCGVHRATEYCGFIKKKHMYFPASKTITKTNNELNLTGIYFKFYITKLKILVCSINFI